MAFKGTRKMERNYTKLFKIIFICILAAVGANLSADNTSQLQNIDMKTFMVPKYNINTKKLEYILTGKNAQTVGTLVKIDDAKLEAIGKDGKSIDIVITTPEAFYDRVADNVKGDKDVHYRSLQMDADGVGFVVNNLNKTIHIDKNVKMWIYQNGRGKKAEEKNKKKSNISEESDSDTAIAADIAADEKEDSSILSDVTSDSQAESGFKVLSNEDKNSLDNFNKKNNNLIDLKSESDSITKE